LKKILLLFILTLVLISVRIAFIPRVIISDFICETFPSRCLSEILVRGEFIAVEYELPIQDAEYAIIYRGFFKRSHRINKEEFLKIADEYKEVFQDLINRKLTFRTRIIEKDYFDVIAYDGENEVIARLPIDKFRLEDILND